MWETLHEIVVYGIELNWKSIKWCHTVISRWLEVIIWMIWWNTMYKYKIIVLWQRMYQDIVGKANRLEKVFAQLHEN